MEFLAAKEPDILIASYKKSLCEAFSCVYPPWWDGAFPQNPWCRWLNALRRESTASPPPSSETETPVAHGWSCPSRSSAPGWETLYVGIKECAQIEERRREREGESYIYRWKRGKDKGRIYKKRSKKRGDGEKLNKRKIPNCWSWLLLLIYKCTATYWGLNNPAFLFSLSSSIKACWGFVTFTVPDSSSVCFWTV